MMLGLKVIIANKSLALHSTESRASLKAWSVFSKAFTVVSID